VNTKHTDIVENVNKELTPQYRVILEYADNLLSGNPASWDSAP